MDNLTYGVVMAGLVILILQAAYCLMKTDRSIAVGCMDLILAAVIAAGVWAVRAGYIVPANDFGTVMAQGSRGILVLRAALALMALLPAATLILLLQWKIRSGTKSNPNFQLVRRQTLVGIATAGLAVGPLASFGIISANPGDPEAAATVWTFRFLLLFLSLGPAATLIRLSMMMDAHEKLMPAWVHAHVRMNIAVIAAQIGIMAGTRLYSLNPADLSSLEVFQYDALWPPLIIWLCVCLGGSVLVLAGEFEPAGWIGFAASWATAMSMYALQCEDLPDTWSRPLWNIIRVASFAVFLGVVAFNMTKTTEPMAPAPKTPQFWRGLSGEGRRRYKLCLGYLTFIGLGVWFAVGPLPVRLMIGLFPLAVWLAFAADSFRGQLLPGEGEAGDGGARWNAAGVAIGLSLPIISLAVADLFTFGYASPAVDVAIALGFWLLFAERLSVYQFERFPRLFVQNQLHFAPFRQWLTVKAGNVRAAATAVGNVVSGGSRIATFTKATVLPIVLAVAALMGLAGVLEIFNYRKIVVSSFAWSGNADSKEDVAFANALAPGVINALGRLHDDLREDLVEAKRSESGVNLLSTGTDTSLSSAVAQSADLEIGGVKVPLTFLTAPVQTVVRKLLGIKVIDGSVRKTSAGVYVVTFNSSTGKSWLELAKPVSGAQTAAADQQPDPAEQKPPSDPKTPDQKASDQKAAAGKKPSAGDQKTLADSTPVADVSGCPDPQAKDPLSQAIEHVAFDIATGEPAFLGLGMSKDMKAFGCFQQGLRSWNSYLLREDPDELTKAESMFSKAADQDHGFALAYYRLGLCLERDHQPGAAIDQFRASYDANPDFVPAASWAARTLYSFNSSYENAPAVLPADMSESKQEEDTARRRQAMEVWSKLASLPRSSESLIDLQRTLYSLCEFERTSLQTQYEDPKKTTKAGDRVYFVPYFYCRKAQGLYSAISSNDREDRDTKSVQAAILNETGIALELHRITEVRIHPPTSGTLLACRANAYKMDDIRAAWRKTSSGGPRPGQAAPIPVYSAMGRQRQALRYYRASLQLVPGDPVVTCNEAFAKSVWDGGDPRPIQSLEHDAGVRFAMAQNLESSARTTDYDPDGLSNLFKMTLDEYQNAISLNPANFDALNGYAYACWEWYLSHQWYLKDQALGASSPPGWQQELYAEKHAREAVRLAYERQRKDLESTALDTLGEVLLEEGRILEAISNMSQAIRQYDYWPVSHEFHWDLAAAEMCAADANDGESRTRHLGLGFSQLALLRSAENTNQGQLQEWRPFHPAPAVKYDLDRALRIHDVTDVMQRIACPVSAPVPQTARFAMVEPPQYASGKAQGITYVTATIEPKTAIGTGQTTPYLHVWGGNINDLAPLSADPAWARSIQVDTPCSATGKTAEVDKAPPKYYVALQQDDGTPLSETKNFSVAGDCKQNWISLTFHLLPAPSASTPPRTGRIP